jgi:cell division protein FtsB
MTAQNLIWDKNYHCKCAMNRVKEENSALKARIWNLEKENRKMERQVDAWNLKDFVNVPNSRKPYIDMATVEKVLADQDYSIVSTKMEIAQLEAQLQEREATFSKLTERNREVGKIVSLLNHEIAVGKVSVCECIELETGVTGAMRG